MITTEQMVYEPTPVDGDARFQVAGRLLAVAAIVVLNKANGLEEERTSHILRSLGEIVAQHGTDVGRGWLEGWHHATGTRDHDTWMTALRILGPFG